MKKSQLTLVFLTSTFLMGCDNFSTSINLPNHEEYQEQIEMISKHVNGVKKIESILENYSVESSEQINEVGIKAIFKVFDSSEVISSYGYFIETKGYNDGINYLLVIDDKEEIIIGFEVISHNETQNGTYGARLLDSPEFAFQFRGINFEEVDSKVDFVAGSTAAHTLRGVKNSVKKVCDFHNKIVLGKAESVNLSSSEMDLLGLKDGYIIKNQTEKFVATLKDKVSSKVFDRIINVEVAEKKNYTKIYNYFDVEDGEGKVKQYGYIVEGQYNCEVTSGRREWKKHKFVFMFDTNEQNVKVIIVSSDTNDSKQSYINDWIIGSFNGQTVSEINNNFLEDKIDRVAGVTFTSSQLLSDMKLVVDAHLRAFGN